MINLSITFYFLVSKTNMSIYINYAKWFFFLAAKRFLLVVTIKQAKLSLLLYFRYASDCFVEHRHPCNHKCRDKYMCILTHTRAYIPFIRIPIWKYGSFGKNSVKRFSTLKNNSIRFSLL